MWSVPRYLVGSLYRQFISLYLSILGTVVPRCCHWALGNNCHFFIRDDMPQLKCVGTSVSLTSNPVFNRLEIGLFNTDCSYWVHSFKCSFQNDEISGLFSGMSQIVCWFHVFLYIDRHTCKIYTCLMIGTSHRVDIVAMCLQHFPLATPHRSNSNAYNYEGQGGVAGS